MTNKVMTLKHERQWGNNSCAFEDLMYQVIPNTSFKLIR